MRRASVVAVAVALSAAGGAFLLLSRSRDGGGKAAAAREEETRQSVETMKEDVAALRAELARVRSERRAARGEDAAPAKAAKDEPAADGAKTAAKDAAPRAPKMDEAELFHSFDQHVTNEPKDATWAKPTESAIAGAFSGPTMEGSTLVAADCHSTMCRVEVRHEDPASQQHFFSEVRNTPPFDTSAGGVRGVPGSDPPRSVVFLAREGHRLPAGG